MFDEGLVLKVMMKGNAIYGDIFAEEKTYTFIHHESGRIEKIEKGTDKGVGIRIIVPWKTYYCSTNSFDEGRLIDLAKELNRFVREGKSSVEINNKITIVSQYPFFIKTYAHDVDTKEKLHIVKYLESIVRKMEKRIKQVRIQYRDTKQNVVISNSEGKVISDSRIQLILTIFIVGEEKGEIQTAYETIGGFYGFDFLSEEIIESLAVKVVKRIQGLLNAREAPMGVKTVVLASEAGGTMIHEAIGHGLEADLAMEHLSCYKDMIGKHIAAPFLTIVDDATLPYGRGTYAYDDEGVQSKRTMLVENGVLKEYLFDRFHALRYGKESTGNGRRDSFRFKPIPRMSNTMILPGHDEPEKILASVDKGIYVRKMGGGQVDTVRGDFVFEIAEGYTIEKGHTGEMIKNATMMGNGLKVLQEIDMVGNDLGFGIGTCGKDGQAVPVSDGQPTLKIPEIIIGGRKRDVS